MSDEHSSSKLFGRRFARLGTRTLPIAKDDSILASSLPSEKLCAIIRGLVRCRDDICEGAFCALEARPAPRRSAGNTSHQENFNIQPITSRGIGIHRVVVQWYSSEGSKATVNS